MTDTLKVILILITYAPYKFASSKEVPQKKQNPSFWLLKRAVLNVLNRPVGHDEKK